MSAFETTLLHHVDEQLAAIFAAPAMWGSEEAIELQVLQLLEFRSLALRPSLEATAPRTVLETYHQLVADEFPGAPPMYLFCLVDELDRREDFVPLLRRITERIVRGMQPEDVFATHDLVLRLWLRDDVHVPRASTLSSYYDVFHRVLRAVSRPTGTRGRASQELERAIDFELKNVVVAAKNGAPANITLPLEEVETSEAETVKQGLAELVLVNEWAANPQSSIAALTSRMQGEEIAQRVAAQALRLMPSRDTAIDVVELGGRLIEREGPVRIRPSYAERMVDVVKQSPTLQPFDVIASVRAVDIDQRSMRIKVGTRSLRCWFEEAHLFEEAQSALGQRVRVRGYQYKEAGSPPFVIVHDVKP